jgi:hypothetical protein
MNKSSPKTVEVRNETYAKVFVIWNSGTDHNCSCTQNKLDSTSAECNFKAKLMMVMMVMRMSYGLNWLWIMVGGRF